MLTNPNGAEHVSEPNISSLQFLQLGSVYLSSSTKVHTLPVHSTKFNYEYDLISSKQASELDPKLSQ